jgi:hypothetical protein
LVSTILESRLVDVNEPDDETGRVPLHRACMVSDPPILKLLLTHTQLTDLEDRTGVTPYQLAVDHGDLPAIATFLEYKKSCGETLTTTEEGCVHVMDLIHGKNPFISTRSTLRSGARHRVSPLQFGAYHLDLSIIQAAITLQNGKDDSEFFVETLKSEWQSEWPSRPIGMDTFSFGDVITAPLFIAMNRALHKQRQGEVFIARERYRDVFDALLLAPSLDLSETGSYMDILPLKIHLVDACCDRGMVCQMARAGLTLPWKFFRWAKDNRIYVVGDERGGGNIYMAWVDKLL